MIEVVQKNYLPSNWISASTNFNGPEYVLVDISTSLQAIALKAQVSGSFNLGVQKVQRVENPYLYGQFLFKKAEYEQKGGPKILELYHDTSQDNITSIVSNNLDRRLAHRVKFGRGVSFSPSPSYANKVSSRANGENRAMIVADVLVRHSQTVYTPVELPASSYDTTTGNCGQVYVKFYDDEFYPKYVVFYKSGTYSHRRGYSIIW